MPSPPQAGERLPLDLKLAFGAPTFASAALAIPVAIHMTKFYADVVQVPLGLLGIAIAVARAFDAVTDPLMGWLSDCTRTRWGRRRPYLALGAPLCALSFWLLFTPPAGLAGRAAALWFGTCFVLYYLFHTVYLVPHLALGPELTPDYHERSSLFGVREAFLILGTLSAAMLPGVLAGAGGERLALSRFALIFGALLVALYAWLVIRVRERPEHRLRPPNPLVPGVRRCLRNRPFVLLLVTSVLAAVPGAMTATLIPFFTHYVLRAPEPQRWLAVLLGTYFGVAFVCLPAWLWLARRFGKRPVWLASFVGCGSGALSLFLLRPGDLGPAVACLAWSGTGFGAIMFLSLAIKADVIDYDELLTGRRREAQFMSLWSLIPKFVTIPAAAIPVALLGSAGYVPNAVQHPDVVLAIRVLIGLVPALIFGVAFAVGWRLPLDEAAHRAVLAGIEAHRAGRPARDPLRGGHLPPPLQRDVPDAEGWRLDHFSRGELERLGRSGPGRLLRDVLAAGAAAFALCAAACSFVAASVRDLASEPGAAAVVVAGLAFSAGVFHALRLLPAWRMRRQPPAPGVVAAHLRALALGGAPRAADRAAPAAG